jgi:putative transposase
MKKSRFTEEQIVKALRAVESGSKTNTEQCRELGVSDATWYKWKKQYGGLDVNEVRRLRELEQENSKLKRMVANLMLEKEAIEEALKKL